MFPLSNGIELNFKDDWKEALIAEMEASGYVIDPNKSVQDISSIYFNWKRRIVAPKKRKVHISKEMKFNPKYRKSFRKIIKHIEMGADITPFLSKTTTRTEYNDLLLNDWKIHHLHLGKKHEDNGIFIERTKDVLFIRFEEKDAYFIQVLDHKSFSAQEMVRIIDKNWPKLIETYQMPVDSTSSSIISDEEKHQFRKNGINSAVSVGNETTYMPIGLGITGAKTSTEAEITSDKYLNSLSLITIKTSNLLF
ncbi:hypothetical protein C1I60_20285 [Paenibacillus terrae]|uniref:Uncharacterized protein n=1 Tax=Paenibacillus terrae TaxID=159743 RepID=A0A4U2PQY6_9BACL|nr:hypothetical protein [Paenibacillus terrae]TKH41665.1 hypothetical protein C1I60_20285 [Paenibacillus terrae]